MNKEILEEIIADYERMLGIITHRLNQLRALRNIDTARTKQFPNRGINYSVGDEVAAKRQQTMREVEKIKNEAKEKARKAKEETDKRLAELKSMPKFPSIEPPLLPTIGDSNVTDNNKKDG